LKKPLFEGLFEVSGTFKLRDLETIEERDERTPVFQMHPNLVASKPCLADESRALNRLNARFHPPIASLSRRHPVAAS